MILHLLTFPEGPRSGAKIGCSSELCTLNGLISINHGLGGDIITDSRTDRQADV